jgi:hypothetical protein
MKIRELKSGKCKEKYSKKRDKNCRETRNE